MALVGGEHRGTSDEGNQRTGDKSAEENEDVSSHGKDQFFAFWNWLAGM
jgi:hypothetical protein